MAEVLQMITYVPWRFCLTERVVVVLFKGEGVLINT